MATAYPTIPGVTFKDIPGFPGYCVGDDGSVWSCRRFIHALSRGGEFKATTDPSQWRSCKFRRSGKRDQSVSIRLCCSALGRRAHKTCIVGRLVLTAFVGPCPDGMECCHDPDPTPTNNHLSNLRWDTRKENAADCIRQGRRPRGEDVACAKLTDEKVLQAKFLRDRGANWDQIGRAFGVQGAIIKRAVTGKGWTHLVDAPAMRTEITVATEGRWMRGEGHVWAKLTEARVIEIRRAYAAHERTQKQLAAMFGVSRRAVAFVIQRKSWAHV